ncbi:MAG TPA: OFA family MFS transporter [Verrucomicrobiota bacterium]|nr:OFA family MFS transporter [Verrucomicrobiota bacterium]HRZ35524.1 OFA family MFS transporter [Candidatus Paceibacterota bacterium]HRZ53941.1 OFA family MFS transporter [Candidatus Paceibacterota bacterium]
MPTESNAPPAPVAHRGWTVTFAGLGINLALGVLYTWSMFKGAIEKEFGWKGDQLNDPYALCCLAFAFTMILAGRCQDKFGPRLTASIGGLLVGAGMVLIATTTSYAIWLLGFGLLVGIGIGFGYSSATPPALKWFPPSKTGLIAGLVVAGFGLAPVYLAPTSQYLLAHFGLQKSMLIFGIAFVILVCALAQLLVNPPPGYVAGATPAGAGPAAPKPIAASATPGEMLRQPLFYLLWIIYFIGAGAGLMVISSIGGMAKTSMGHLAFIAVAVMAIGNAGGRILAGMLSDKIGRRGTLFLVLLFQAVLMFAAIPVTGAQSMAAVVVVVVAALIGANYGANLALFPSYCKDLWGLKSFGINYGLLFTAWGLGGFALSALAQRLVAASQGSYRSSFITAGVLLLIGAGLTFLIKPPQPKASA